MPGVALHKLLLNKLPVQANKTIFIQTGAFSFFMPQHHLEKIE
jgi:hypothetical protein